MKNVKHKIGPSFQHKVLIGHKLQIIDTLMKRQQVSFKELEVKKADEVKGRPKFVIDSDSEASEVAEDKKN